MRRTLALAATVAVAALALPAVPASADHLGQVGCPPPFDALDEAEQFALAEQLGLSPEVVVRGLEHYDKNGDRILCLKFLPNDIINVIDNRSATT